MLSTQPVCRPAGRLACGEVAAPPSRHGHADPGPPRPERVEQSQPVHRLVRLRPHRQGPRARPPRRGRLADAAGHPARRRPHVAAAPGHRAPPTWCSTAIDRLWIPVRRSWRLNERHYGDLTGLDKAETNAEVRRRAGPRSGGAATTCRPRPSTAANPYNPNGARAVRGTCPPTSSRHRVPQGRRRPDAAVLVSTPSFPT